MPQADSPVKAASADESSSIPLGPVVRCVVIASMGAFAFGYHLGVVNGPLEAIAADLGFAGNAGLQGAVSLVCQKAGLQCGDETRWQAQPAIRLSAAAVQWQAAQRIAAIDLVPPPAELGVVTVCKSCSEPPFIRLQVVSTVLAGA